MATLIALARLLIADTGATPLLSDDQIQQKLDEVRRGIFQGLLTPLITYTNTGGMLYNDYEFRPNGKPIGFWEANEVLLRGDWTPITPLTSDENVGHWTFNDQLPPVFIRGRYFDLYHACADLLDYKIANLAATAINFTSDGQGFQLNQQIQTLMAMRDDYRRKQRAMSHPALRDDVAGDAYRGTGIAPNQERLVGPVSANVPFLTGE
jgi:hypothetical protein